MSMFLMRLLTTACPLYLLLVSPAQSAIILNIDTSAETWSLGGSDTGVPSFHNSNNELRWEFNLGSGTNNVTYTQTPAAAVTVWTPSDNVSQLREFSGVGGATIFELFFQDPSPSPEFGSSVTITPFGGPLSYSGLSPASKTWFEGLVGNTIPVTDGTNFSPIAVIGVPEPTTATLALAATLFFVGRRRGR